MTFRERFEWLLRIGLLVFVLAAAAFLSAVMAMRFAIQGREVDIPDLTSKSSVDAQAILQGRGLRLKVVDRIYSDLPANEVVRQSPPAGEHLKIAQDAHVVLSLGPQNVTIPNLAGVTLRIARIQLLQAGLQLGEVTAYPISGAAVDTVVQQDPGPGTRAMSLRVNLLVAQDEPSPGYVMPWLVGMQQLDAERLLAAGQLKLTRSSEAPSPQWPRGTIIEQIPDQGSEISWNVPIEIVVAQ